MTKLPGGRIDYTGQTFGYWTALYPVTKEKYKYYWHCRCKCGKEKDVLTTSLVNEKSKSCGCLRAEENQKRFLKDLTGQRFGKLTVIKKSFNRSPSGKLKWLCKCDCGNIKEFIGEDLYQNKISSCGCLKSKGENKILKILNENNIKYKYHYFVSECKFNNINSRGAEFDFCIYNSDNTFYFIEYDGIQHFAPKSEKGWNNSQNFLLTKEHDKIKNDYCLTHNIPLIRIPYTQIDNLSINDLILTTSNYIINKE